MKTRFWAASCRRLLLASMALAAMAVGAGVAVADGGGDGNGFRVIFSSEGPTDWVITGAACSTIPDDAVITGTGTNSLVIKERINQDGTATLMFTGKARGTAVDQDGNSYRWSYNNHERATNTLAAPDVYVGPITDSFVLSGQGPLRIRASFLGTITENLGLGTFAIVPTKVIGDPINFATNESHCDPI